ncbi:gluconokinase [Cohnella sp. GbtcB17]|uniref:gluconokinase n=1 Tax=Cohnella sp. GbtcB17 TaxID=2824762 RepID=UPI001C301159|nr:gluconokinase [Cohnella sp. GbtcB17]
MHASKYMIGVDIGTTSTKSVLFEESGKPVAQATIEYPLYTPSPVVAEQDPDEIFRAVVQTLRSVMDRSGIDPGLVLFVSFSSAMHSLIAVDGEGRPLTRSITWGDNRSAAWAERLREDGSGHAIYLRTGTPIHPMSPLTKLMWLRESHGELFRTARRFISIKEYVFAELFGEYVVDHSIASATGLMNLERLDWDEEALAAAGVTADRLSQLVPTTHALAGLQGDYARQTGLAADTPFIVGASDGVLSNLGVGAIEPGVVAATIGTSGAIRTVTDRPAVDPKGRTFCYALTERHWVIGGAVNNGGVLLRWAREEFGSSVSETAKRLRMDPNDLLMDIAAKVPAGSEGLLFHPYMTGERSPLWDANARGSFFGLTLHHGKEHMLRAVLEGVIFNLYTVLLAVEERIGRPRRIHATGGFARSALWRQMMADIFDQELVVPESFESSCLGAAVLGLFATGRIGSLNVAAGMVGATHRHVPDPAHAAVYHKLLPIFIGVSRRLKDEYRAIAAFQRELAGE